MNSDYGECECGEDCPQCEGCGKPLCECECDASLEEEPTDEEW